MTARTEARESVNYLIGGINNQITDEFGSDNDLEVTGGGKGWTATTTIDGVVHTAKASSKLSAAENLYEQIKAQAETGADDLDFEDMSDEEIAQCVAECVGSVTNYCACRCDGKNHGAGAGAGRAFKTVLGDKLCKCGCGQVTKRLFVPGHDARFHGLQVLRSWIAETGFVGTEDEARKARLAEQRKAARARRQAKLEAAKVATEQAVEKIVAGAETEAKVKRSRKAKVEAVSPKGDDLPF